MSIAAIEQDLAQSIEKTLRQAALRNERKLAALRAALLTLTVVVSAFFGAPRIVVVVAGLWMVIAAAASLALLRDEVYRPQFGWIFSLLDGAILLSAVAMPIVVNDRFFDRLSASGIAVVCAITGLSGVLRIHAGMAGASAVLATTSFLVAASVRKVSAGETFFVAAAIFSGGVLALSMISSARRAVRDQVRSMIVRRFLPDAVVDAGTDIPLPMVLEPRAAEATILITDIRGFTSLVEHVTPSQAFEFLNDIQGRFAAVVRDHEGTVDKFIGDGMLAVFTGNDHAGRAVNAAESMLQLPRSVRIGIGVHSGPVVTGSIGNGSRLEFTVIGDTVNTASRLEAMTKQQGVELLVSAATLSQLSRPPELRPIGELQIRGRDQRLLAYAPL